MSSKKRVAASDADDDTDDQHTTKQSAVTILSLYVSPFSYFLVHNSSKRRRQRFVYRQTRTAPPAPTNLAIHQPRVAYVSISYVQLVPVDAVHVNCSFVPRILTNVINAKVSIATSVLMNVLNVAKRHVSIVLMITHVSSVRSKYARNVCQLKYAWRA